MTEGLQLGPVNRPEPTIRPIHWWQKIAELTSILRRIDERQENANSFKLAIDEYTLEETNATQIIATAQTNNPCVITGFIAACSAATAVLQIGNRQIPLPQGTTIQTGLTIIRYKKDDAVLTSTGAAGTMFLEIMGYEQPRMAL